MSRGGGLTSLPLSPSRALNDEEPRAVDGATMSFSTDVDSSTASADDETKDLLGSPKVLPITLLSISYVYTFIPEIHVYCYVVDATPSLGYDRSGRGCSAGTDESAAPDQENHLSRQSKPSSRATKLCIRIAVFPVDRSDHHHKLIKLSAAHFLFMLYNVSTVLIYL